MTAHGHPQAQRAPDTVRRLLRGSAIAVLVTGVSLWMLLWLLVAFIGVPFGADSVCAETPGAAACGAVFLPAWFALMGVEILATIMTVVLWASPGRRYWGFILGLLGTSGTTVLFSLAFGLPL